MHNVSAFLFLLIATSAFGASPDSFVDRARALKLADQAEWHRLLHYRHTLIGWKSQAVGENFFVATDGKTNPDAELEATIRGFFSAEKRKLDGKHQPQETVKCQFPARYEWLDRELQLSANVPKQECKEWDEFRERMAVKSVTYVFSSFFVGNPSSTYGHSLIRLNKSESADGSEHHQLLDYGVNYAAEATTDNPILYAFFGLAGMFRGSFTALPYYYKVREYADLVGAIVGGKRTVTCFAFSGSVITPPSGPCEPSHMV